MHPLLAFLLIAVAFGSGVGIGVSLKNAQMKSEAGLKRLLAREREKGRLEGSAGRGNLEPPKPWTDNS